MLFLVKNSMVKKEVRDNALSDATANYFVAEVRCEVFAHYRTVTVKVIVVCGIVCLAYQDEFFL
jgi:hypothetical protein